MLFIDGALVDRMGPNALLYVFVVFHASKKHHDYVISPEVRALTLDFKVNSGIISHVDQLVRIIR